MALQGLAKIVALSVAMDLASPSQGQVPPLYEEAEDQPTTFTDYFMRWERPLEAVPHACDRPAKHFWYERTRGIGELELVSATQTAKTEEVWIYADGKWYEVGVCEERGRVNSGPIGSLVLSQLPSATKEMSAYHIHPADAGRVAEAPSHTDIVTAIRVLYDWKVKFPQAKSDFRIATPSGIYIIELHPSPSGTNQGLDNIESVLMSKTSNAYPQLHILPKDITMAEENQYFCGQFNGAQQALVMRFVVNP